MGGSENSGDQPGSESDTIGARVKRLREKHFDPGEEKCWSQARLAEAVKEIAKSRGRKLSVQQQHIGALETGEGNTVPRYLIYLAKALGVSADWLLDGDASGVSAQYPQGPEGLVKNSDTRPAHDQSANQEVLMSSDVQQLIEAYSDLDPETRRLKLQEMKALAYDARKKGPTERRA